MLVAFANDGDMTLNVWYADILIKNEIIAAKIKGGTTKRHADSSGTQLENSHSDIFDLRISTHKGGHKLDTSLGN